MSISTLFQSQKNNKKSAIPQLTLEYLFIVEIRSILALFKKTF